MSGHNRWTKIKRQKAAQGASKGKLFTKLIREITVSAKQGGGEPASNARLRLAMQAAREANMPNDTIARAIKKGTGEMGGSALEEVIYEGYGPGGVAILVECLTDNLNRTAGDIRSIFAKQGGNLAAAGSVRFLFERKGVIGLGAALGEEEVMGKAIEAGAEDVVFIEGEGWEIHTLPADLQQVAQALEQKALCPRATRWNYFPSTLAKIEGEAAGKLMKLLELLEEHDDVQNVFSNFEMDDATMDAISGA
ncbi:MAG: YebC/PmpR family DNA-binding transcriptional regulator [Proteobacteria bacterium]|nr:YebC/PmpR family DNA-binding transcriptional regulator [Cystobacterineae bacterium]MCL2313758.1 YebC/PmpR family DNA-binding transcriptional regulator [Pseudomonadota bacterium]